MVALVDVRTPVDAPPHLPSSFGVFSVVPARPDSGPHWRNGVMWETLVCGMPGIVTDQRCLTAEEVDGLLLLHRDCAIVEGEPFTVSVVGAEAAGDMDDAQAASYRERLLLGEEQVVGAKLRGLLAAAVPSPTAITAFSGSERVRLALGHVEQELRRLYPGQGVIHVDPVVATVLDLSASGGRMTTPLGTPVIVAVDEVEAAAADTGTVIYGTGAVVLYREATPSSIRTFDRAVNDWQFIEQRTYVVAWDCTAIGAAVTY